MKFFLPVTLKARALLILCSVFFISHAASLLIYEANRDEAIISLLIYVLMVTLLALALTWYLISKAVAPLGRLAKAAEEIGVNIDAPPLHEEGPKEVVVAARAFNGMQARLQRLVHGQTEMIGAISHDLRSAVTRLQLRGELLNDEKERRGLLQVIEDMKLMVQSAIDFVRGYDPNEQARKINVTALVESLCEDLMDEGFPITYQTTAQSIILFCRPVSLRRGIQNVIDNAVKYGRSAHVTLTATANDLIISIEDEGPGIPEDKLEKVLKPFFRLESSRNSETGGVGLGLAITRNAIHTHGGVFRLSNREQGGLRAEIQLPLGNAEVNRV